MMKLDNFVGMMTGHFDNKDQFKKMQAEGKTYPYAAKWLSEGKKLGGFVNDGYFIDIGIPEDYYRFGKDVEKGVITW